MESSIAPLANKIDDVLKKLGVASADDEKKLSKAQMENIFDNILSSDDGEGA